MVSILEFLFVSTILLCLSTYAFYPAVIMLIGKLFPFKPIKADESPTISILIAAYNEEKDIRKKLENTLALDYPAGKMEILVGSDGSTDRTPQIANEFSNNNVNILEFSKNRGKTAVQNDLVTASKHEILIFTDAASFLDKDSLVNLIKPFSDRRVGAVAGTMVFLDQDQNLTTQSQGMYWKYELNLREAESALGRLIGVDGPLYAVRRENYVPLQPHIISDLLTPLMVLKQKKKVVLEKKAVVYEAPTTKSSHELRTRRRITLRGLVGLISESRLLSPLHFPGLSIQIIFHKLLRWAVGPLVILNLLICIILSAKPFFYLFFILHILFYAAALLGWILEKIGKPSAILKVPYYFCLVNLAATLGILDFVRKKRAVSWKPVRN